MSTYTVTVTREDPYWVAVVSDVPGGATETRTLSTLEGEVRDLLAGLTDSAEEDIVLTWDYSHAVTPRLAGTIAQLRQTRDALQAIRDTYEKLQRDAAHGVRDEGVSVRDAAVLLDMSHQRVAQLAS